MVTTLPGAVNLSRESTSFNPNHSHYYVHSGDCADRFYKAAAEGEVVRRLRLKPMCPDCRNGMDLTDVRYPAELERLAKIEKEKEKLMQTETLSLGSESNCVRSFEKLWCEGWESPCVETAASPDDE